MPHDLDAERALLGSLILDPELFHVARDVVVAGDFFDARNAETWCAIDAVVRAGVGLDTASLRGHLELAGRLKQAGGDEYLLGLTTVVPTLADVEQRAERIRDLAVARAAIQGAMQLISEARNIDDLSAYLDQWERLPEACVRRTARAQPVSAADAVERAYRGLLERPRHGLRGVATRFARLDRVLGGLCPGDMIVLAARPGMGKSALAQAIACNVAGVGRPVLFIALEMNAEGLADRMLAADASIDLRRVRTADVREGEWASLARAADGLSRLPLHIVEDRNVTVLDVRRAARRLARRTGELGLIVVDYLQLVRPAERDRVREREIAEVSATLKTIAGELHVPVLALSQLNRAVESRADKRPMLSDLRESGAIEQDADAVMFLYRDEVYDPESKDRGIAEVIVAKQRNGPVGTVKLRWTAECARFDNLQEQDGGYYAN